MVDLFLLSQAQMRRILRGINSSEKLRRLRLFFSLEYQYFIAW